MLQINPKVPVVLSSGFAEQERLRSPLDSLRYQRQLLENMRLLEAIGAGNLAESPEALSAAIHDLLGDHAAGWRSMKNALIRHGRNAGAIAGARFILNEISNPHP